MERLTWLHLSDWHQRGVDAYNRGVVRDALVEDILRRERIDPALRHVAFVVFSGDLSYSGKDGELEAAREQLLEPVLQAVGLGPDRLFLVPGNHDVDRSEFKFLPPAVQQPLESEAEMQEWLVRERERAHVLGPFRTFEAFTEAYSGLQHASWAPVRTVEAAGIRVALLGLNSALMCRRGGSEDYGSLTVGEPQVLDALGAGESADLRIAVVHHPVEWLQEFDRSPVGDELGRACHFILHGHEHEQRIRVELGPRGDHIKIPCGASYDRRRTQYSRHVNAYNFVHLELKRGTGTIHLRKWSDQGRKWIQDAESVDDGRYTFALPKQLGTRGPSASTGRANVVPKLLETTVVFKAPAANPNFTGREDLLASLAKAMASDSPSGSIQAVTGLAGAGKTQLAAEYANRHRTDYRLVWWVRAETSATMLADLAALAAEVRVASKAAADHAEAAGEVVRWLEANTGWLLVFDDAEGPDQLGGYMPRCGHVLVTSRNPAWRARAVTLRIGPWRPEESTAFLIKRAESKDTAGAEQVADVLGHLPLALEQAAAFMDEHGTSFSAYVRLFKRHRSKMLTIGTAADHKATVASTWALSLTRIRSEFPASPELLELCAFLAPEAIPEDLLRSGGGVLPEAVQALDDLAFEQAIGTLRRHSLVQREDGTLIVHRLVQQAVADGLPATVRLERVRACLLLLSEAFPDIAIALAEHQVLLLSGGDLSEWGRCAPLVPHVLAVVGHAEDLRCEPDITSSLLDRAGTYFRGRAEFSSARACFERAVAIDEATHGNDDPLVARDLRNLGWVHKDLAELDRAKPVFERALTIDENRLGKNDPQVARDLHGVGWVLKDRGDLEGAKATFERALSIDRDVLGSSHPQVARDLHSLGWVLKDLGDLEGARDCFTRALDIDERASEDRAVVEDLRSLGWALKGLGDLGGAKTTFESALSLRERGGDAEDVDVWRELRGLGWVLKDLGDPDGARQAFERAVRCAEHGFGFDHPSVGRALIDFAAFLRQCGDPAATPTFDRALAIYETTLGSNHPTVVRLRRETNT